MQAYAQKASIFVFIAYLHYHPTDRKKSFDCSILYHYQAFNFKSRKMPQ
jgi:hypothetical protein